MPPSPASRAELAASERVRCPICGSDAHTAWRLARNGYDLHHCADCDHWVVSPFPTAQELARIYSFEGGYQTHAAAGAGHVREIPPKFSARVDRLARHRARGRLLDVGCSYGEFLGVARERGFEVQGVEMSADTAAIARAQGIPVFVGSLADARFPDASFDVVHAGDVIEHLTDVQSFAAEVRRVLRPDGLLVMSTPNHDAFFPRATFALWRWLRIPWSHATPPFHLHQFSTRSLERLLAAHDLATVDVYFTPVDLAYELRATGCFSALKRAARSADVRGALHAGVAACGVLACYPLVRLVDRALAGERSDATVNLIASPPASVARSATPEEMGYALPTGRGVRKANA